MQFDKNGMLVEPAKPITSIKTRRVWDKNTGEVFMVRQDDGLKETAKWVHEKRQENLAEDPDLIHLGRVPLIVLEKLCHDAGVSMNDDAAVQEVMFKFLTDKSNPFRVAKKDFGRMPY